MPARRRGFTLIEVLVALAVVALGAAAVMTALTTGSQSTSRLRERAYAEWVALNRLAEIRVAREWPMSSGAVGEELMGGSRWQWRQTIERSDLDGVWRIRVDARPANSAGANDWLATVHGARADNIAQQGADAGIWDSAGSNTL